MNNELKNYELVFTKPIIKYGRFLNLLAVLLCFIPSLVCAIVFGAMPAINDILKGWGLVASVFLVYAIVEPISYFPLMGLPGTYLGCLSGNIGNVRVPASAIAQENIAVEPGSKKAELVSTLGICGSIVTNLLVVTIAAVGGAALLKLFPPVILEAFEYVTPAIFGAMFGMSAVKNWKYGIVAIIIGIICIELLKLPTYACVPILVFGTILFAFGMEKFSNKKADK